MISLYAPGKPTPVAAEAVKGIREGWESWVKRSDVIVVIGARVLHQDRHIYTPLKKAPGHIWYVGATNGFQIHKRPVVQLARRFDKALDGELTKRIRSVAGLR
jgi:hypothetical protein